MIKGHQNKMQKPAQDKSLPKALVCKVTGGLDMPGIGHFEEGDKVTDPLLIEAIADNPNFEASKEA